MIRWLVTLSVVTVFVRPTAACTIVNSVFSAGPNFRVALEDRGLSAAGFTVILSRGATRIGHAVTDKDGVAHFRQVAPGTYQVSAAAHLGTGYGAEVKVTRTGRAGTVVRLDWLRGQPIHTRSLKGHIRAPANIRDDLPRVVLEIKDRKTGWVLRAIDLAESGDFDLSSISAGIYFLRLSAPGSDFDVQTAVEVNPNAAGESLDLDVGETSCGWWFMDRSACPPAELRLTQLSGRINDTSGAAIPWASVMLLDDVGRIAAMKTSDEKGAFASIEPAQGLYKLEIRSSGFTPFRANLTVSAAGKSMPLEFTLGLLGTCGTVGPK